MGDCLKQAQKFIAVCEHAFADMENACPTIQSTSLTKIQKAAKLNHARAIYRAAQDAFNVLENKNLFAHQLNALVNIVSQYKTGLTELEGYETDVKQNKESINQDIQSKTELKIEVVLSDEDRRNLAMTALCSSIDYAKTKERPALSSLISLSKQQKIAPMHANLGIETLENRTTSPISPPSKQEKKILLETIMPGIIHQSLSQARQSGLTLSLSYDLNNMSLSQIKLTELSDKIKHWVGSLVHHMASGTHKKGLAHIDITAQKKRVTLSCKTNPLSDKVFTTRNGTHQVTQNFDEQSGQLKIFLNLEDEFKKLRRKQQPLPVEAGLSERLEALMSIEDKNNPSKIADVNSFDDFNETPLVAL